MFKLDVVGVDAVYCGQLLKAAHQWWFAVLECNSYSVDKLKSSYKH